jgi:hypothetical protein
MAKQEQRTDANSMHKRSSLVAMTNAQFFGGLESKTKVDDEGVRYFLQRVSLAFGMVGLRATCEKKKRSQGRYNCKI